VISAIFEKLRDIPPERLDKLTKILSDPVANLYDEKIGRLNKSLMAQCMGMLSNEHVPVELLTDLAFTELTGKSLLYNIGPRILAQILKRKDPDSLNVRSACLSRMLELHTGKAELPSDIDMQIDDPKKIAKRIFSMGIGLNMFRVLGDEDLPSISMGYDKPFGLLEKSGFGKGKSQLSDVNRMDKYTDRGERLGFHSVCYAPTYESAAYYRPLKARSKGGSHILGINIPIQDIIEARWLLGAEDFYDWQANKGAISEDPWTQKMSNEPPPKTIREGLERIFSLYTLREIMVPVPMNFNRYQYMTEFSPYSSPSTKSYYGLPVYASSKKKRKL
jgi:hypothetical protein